MLTLYAYLPLNNFVKNILGVEKASRFLLVTTNVICLFPSKEPEWCLKDVFVFFPWEKKKKNDIEIIEYTCHKKEGKNISGSQWWCRWPGSNISVLPLS